MEWAVPLHTRTQVDIAARQLLALMHPHAGALNGWDYEAFDRCLGIVNNWRSSHSYPLNTFQVGLRTNIRHQKTKAPWIVAQRIKRLPAIALKLRLNKSMQLSQMQDIGGCRAVVPTVRDVNVLVAAYKASGIKHELVRPTDYITKPRSTGYRSVHLIYRYHSDKNKQTYNGLRIEMQIRSRLQHAWATAVETVGEFIGQALKSNLGEAAWLRFFQLMGSAMATEENTEPVPGTPLKRSDLIKELRHSARELNVERTLRAFGNVMETRVNIEGADLFLIATEPLGKTVHVTGFPRGQSEKAMEKYAATEKQFAGTGAQVVLTSVDSFAKLRRAYPSYFLESRLFMRALKRATRP